MFSDNAVLNDTPQLMPHNYCTCSLIQIWHTTNYNFSKYLIKKKYVHGFQDLSFATECTNNIANGWLIQHGVRGSSLKHIEVRCLSCFSNTTQSTGMWIQQHEVQWIVSLWFRSFSKYNDQKHTHTQTNTHTLTQRREKV